MALVAVEQGGAEATGEVRLESGDAVGVQRLVPSRASRELAEIGGVARARQHEGPAGLDVGRLLPERDAFQPRHDDGGVCRRSLAIRRQHAAGEPGGRLPPERGSRLVNHHLATGPRQTQSGRESGDTRAENVDRHAP